MKAFRPVLFLALILLIVGLACSAVTGGEDTPPPPVVTEEPVEPVNVQPTDPPATEAPTEAPATEVVVVTEAPVAKDYFTEEFDTPLTSDWSYFTITASDKADAEKVTVEADNGKLVWEFDSEWVYYYLFYGGHEYEDVKLDVRADNRGKNNNSVSLVCRYTPDEGWYEFNIANNGLYSIIFMELLDNGKIRENRIANGGSNDINQGKETNEYSITCEDDQLTLTINGSEAITIPERKYGLSSGQVGISVSSFNVLPILVEMDWFQISEP